jgi:hypothetical protein
MLRFAAQKADISWPLASEERFYTADIPLQNKSFSKSDDVTNESITLFICRKLQTLDGSSYELLNFQDTRNTHPTAKWNYIQKL